MPRRIRCERARNGSLTITLTIPGTHRLPRDGGFTVRSCSTRRSSSALPARRRHGEQQADPRPCKLVLRDPRLQRHEVLGQQHAGEMAEGHLGLLVDAQDLGVVLRLSRVVLLPVLERAQGRRA